MRDASLSPSDVDEVILVGGSTRIPAVQELVKRLFGRDPHKGVNPDEVVALGAAVQAGVLSGEVTDLLLLDVTPLSLGIETLGGVFTRLIERNTTIPTRKTDIFSTAADGQTSVEIHVLQGERDFAKDNRTLARFHLEGLPPAPRGIPQIEVTFDIDANGILNVSAVDKATSKKQDVRIEASSTLNDAEIENMVKNAERHATEDRKRRDLVEARNQADMFIYRMEKTLKEYGDKVDESTKRSIESRLEELRRVKDGDDTEKIKTMMQEIERESYSIAEQMYKKASEGTPSNGNTSSHKKNDEQTNKGKDDDVIDAEYEEKR
jgi:molecular chaperone DnaK